MKPEEDFLQQCGLTFLYAERETSDLMLHLISKLLTKEFQTADLKMTYLVLH